MFKPSLLSNIDKDNTIPFLQIQKKDFLLLNENKAAIFLFDITDEHLKYNSFFDLCPIEWKGVFLGSFNELEIGQKVKKELYDQEGNRSTIIIEDAIEGYFIYPDIFEKNQLSHFPQNAIIQLLIKDSRDAIALVSQENKFIDYNSAMVNLLERLVPNEIGLLNQYRALYNRSKRVKTGINSALNGETYTTEVAYYTKDDDSVYVKTIYQPIFNEANQVYACLVRCKDVTARNSVEDMFSLMLNSGNTGYILVDQYSKICKVNKHLADLLQYSQEELIGVSFLEYVHSSIREHVKKEFHQIVSSDLKTSINEKTFLDINRKDGESLLFELDVKRVILGNHSFGMFVTLKNITQKERNSHILREMQRLIKACGWVYDRFSKKMLVTEEVSQVVGVSKEFVEKNPSFLLSMCDNKSRKEAMVILRNAYKKQDDFDLELCIRLKYKGEQWVRLTGRPIIRHNKVVGLYGGLQDISQQKNALTQLKRHEAYMKEIQRVTKVGNWVYEVDEQRYYWSDYLFNMLGAAGTEKQIPSLRHQFKYIYNSYKFPLMEAVKQLSIHHQPIDLDVRCNNCMKEISGIEYLNIQARPIFNKKGKLLRFVGAVTDITDRKLEEESNKSKKIWLKSMINAARDSFIAEYSGRVANYNRGLQKLLGYNNFFDLRGSVIIDFFHKEDQRKVIVYRQQCRRGDISAPQKIEVRMKRRDGVYVNVELSANLAKIKGRLYTIFNAHDISKRKEYEEGLLEKNHELEVTNKELDRFLYSTTHDLKGPITSIKGLLNLANKETADTVKQTYLPMMDKNVDRILDLIKDFGEFLRNNRNKVEPKSVSLKDELKSIIATHQFSMLPQQKLNIEVKMNRGFNTDKNRIRSILTNLFTNSIKYFDVDKENHFLNIKIYPEKKGIMIAFEDNGEGIGKNDQSKVFDMFYRASETGDGTGLGLFIVKEAVEVLKGTISLESIKGKGTVVKVYVPEFI
ncbi:PAS domain S-box protein [Flammeovirga agarivorans]|uniref:histidine kinase n=1 Tax=Flammeovirga agarivorans TaxID=2726742 RepID=A0A7X8SQR5_9BACT|nr:PAS domain S-box protein [Flammeovirga agarivorans]NLR94645.1 PAS domain S-box protein [Flammeovirga agarivorans]